MMVSMVCFLFILVNATEVYSLLLSINIMIGSGHVASLMSKVIMDKKVSNSPVWKHCKLVEENGKKKIKCNTCRKSYTYDGGCTSSALKHLKTHPALKESTQKEKRQTSIKFVNIFLFQFLCGKIDNKIHVINIYFAVSPEHKGSRQRKIRGNQ